MKISKKIRITLCIFGIILLLFIIVAKIEEIAETIHDMKVWIFSRLIEEKEVVIDVDCEPFSVDYDMWYDSGMLMIAHAGGGLDGKAYLESLECVENSIQNGFSFFELDFIMTSDSQIAIRHDWGNTLYETDYTPDAATFEEYINTPYCYKYTPLSLQKLLEIMQENPEMYIITDTMDAVLSSLVQLCMENECEELLDRFIIQIYYEGDYDTFSEIYPFKNYIYTLYMQDQIDYNEVVRFCLEHDIHVITMQKEILGADIVEAITGYNIHVYTHTVNTITEVKEFADMGVTGFYTDFLIPSDFQYIE